MSSPGITVNTGVKSIVSCLVLVQSSWSVDFEVTDLAFDEYFRASGQFVTVLDNELFFMAGGPAVGDSIYRSDGTSVNRIELVLWPPPDARLIAFNGNVYASPAFGPPNFNILGLFKTDGTTVEYLGGPVLPFEFNGDLVFWDSDGLAKIDGTRLIDLTTIDVRSACCLVEFAGELFFTGDGEQGEELYKTDGTTVSLVADIRAGSLDSWPGGFTQFNGELIFRATGANGSELYKTDGRSVVEVADLNPEPGGSYPGFDGFVLLGDEMFFTAETALGKELYKTDGTSVQIVGDINPGPADSRPDRLLLFKDELFFTADGLNGRELFKTDGTAVAEFDVNPGKAGSSPENFVHFGDDLLFAATGPNGRELYRTDGVGVVEVGDVNPGPDDSDPYCTEFASELVCAAMSPDGPRLYASNGESFTEIAEYEADWAGGYFVPMNDKLFFFAGGSGLYVVTRVPTRMPGDANADSSFDQLDLVQVLQAGKYLTGDPVTWGEGDWNNDGVFDQLDVIAAAETGLYMTGPYAMSSPEFAAVPEPSTLVLMLMAAMVAGVSIRRTIV